MFSSYSHARVCFHKKRWCWWHCLVEHSCTFLVRAWQSPLVAPKPRSQSGVFVGRSPQNSLVHGSRSIPSIWQRQVGSFMTLRTYRSNSDVFDVEHVGLGQMLVGLSTRLLVRCGCHVGLMLTKFWSLQRQKWLSHN